MIKVGIVGGTGYTGVELLRLLVRHGGVELRATTSRRQAGMPVARMFPGLRGHVELAFIEPLGTPVHALGLAVLVQSKMPNWMRSIFRSALFFPLILSAASVSLIIGRSSRCRPRRERPTRAPPGS